MSLEDFRVVIQEASSVQGSHLFYILFLVLQDKAEGI